MAGEAAQGAPPDVFAYVRTLDATAGLRLWPGFNPAEMPIALFDGEKTILLRHPNPPPEFSPMPDRPDALFFKGRYPAVVSNSVAAIGGIPTGTVLATPEEDIHGTLLACIEEAFHVFWRPRHPSFRPDEIVRYGYPIDDPENLVRLIAEDEALARAVEAADDATAAGWAAAAFRIRAERTASLPDDVRAYETALETLEGTANWISRISLGETPGLTAERLRQARPADGIRWRFYDSGAAVCMILERIAPDWKVRTEKEPTLAIGELLRGELAQRQIMPKEFSTVESERFRSQAATRIADLSKSRRELRDDVHARPGSRIIIELPSGSEPFRIERFDPMSLSILDNGEVVHANYLTLRAGDGSVAVTNPDFVRRSFAGTVCLTVPAGRHPLMDGIRRLTVVGMRTAPRIARADGVVTIDSPEVRASLPGADVRVDGLTIHITLPIR